MNKIMIITGASGGHIYPALSLCEILRKKYRIKWICSNKNIDYLLLKENKFNCDFVYFPNIRNISFLNFIFYLFHLVNMIIVLCYKIVKWNPDFVLGFGGYVSFWGVLCAWICNIKIIIHESNSVWGVSNKFLYFLSNKSFHGINPYFNSVLVGNPVRKEIMKLKLSNLCLANKMESIRILILGGSQGSEFINKVINLIIKRKVFSNYFFWHQTGEKDFLNSRSYRKYNKKYLVSKFIKQIHLAYKWSDLIISRSGSGVVSEISSMGLASILVPCKHKDMHQFYNAKLLSDINAAIIINEKDFVYLNLINVIKKLNKNILKVMSRNSILNNIDFLEEVFMGEIKNI